VDQRAEVSFKLDVGDATESIEVSGEAPLVDTSSATVGKVVENRRIQDLPLNGRNALALVMLAPGVKSQAGPTNSGFVDRGHGAVRVSINGGPKLAEQLHHRWRQQQQRLPRGHQREPHGGRVQEFKVQSNVMSAEFGFTAGGVVNIVTRSGSNIRTAASITSSVTTRSMRVTHSRPPRRLSGTTSTAEPSEDRWCFPRFTTGPTAPSSSSTTKGWQNRDSSPTS
jgi:hypothetical protein